MASTSNIQKDMSSPLVESELVGPPDVSHGGLPHVPSERELRRACLLRNRYLCNLGMYRIVTGSFVPNLEVFTRPSAELIPGESHSERPSTRLTIDNDEDNGDPRSFFAAGSIRSSLINISAAALGAGALSLPFAFCNSGLIAGLVLMVFLGMLAVVSIKFIIQAIEESNLETYEELAFHTYGTGFAYFIEANMIFFCFGTAVGYMLTVGDLAFYVLHLVDVDGMWYAPFFSRWFVLIVISLCILLPLSTLDSINKLRFASLFGVCCILYLIVAVFYVFVRQSMSPTIDGTAALQPKGGFMGIVRMTTLAIFAYSCHPNVPAIYCELEKRSYRRMDKVSVRAMSLCFFIYVLMGVCGFLAYGETTSSNIMHNLLPRVHYDPIVAIGFVGMACAVTLAFPLNVFPIRYCVETVLVFKWESLENHRSRMRFCVTTIVVLLAWICAVLIPSLSTIFSLVGAFSGSIVCYIAPAMFFIKLVPGPLFSWHKAKAICVFTLGIIFLVVGTSCSIIDVINPPVDRSHR